MKMKNLSEQTIDLVQRFPPHSTVVSIADDVQGVVEGYRCLSNEVRVIVHVPGDTWTLLGTELKLLNTPNLTNPVGKQRASPQTAPILLSQCEICGDIRSPEIEDPLILDTYLMEHPEAHISVDECETCLEESRHLLDEDEEPY